MGRTFNNNNEHIEGREVFDFAKDKKDFDVIGSNLSDTLVLDGLRKKKSNDPGHIDVHYDGGAGYDALEFLDVSEAIQVTAFGPGSAWDFYVTGGHGKLRPIHLLDEQVDVNPDFVEDIVGTGHTLSSLETWGKSVEKISATRKADTFDLSASNLAFEVRGNGGNDHIQGSSAGDLLFGDSGQDTINGNAGEDRITGGTGNDVLYGGADADTFVFGSNDGNDVIMDLAAGDRISGTDMNVSGVSFSHGPGGATTMHIGATTVQLNGIGHVTIDDFSLAYDPSAVGQTALRWNGTTTGLTDLEAAQYIASHPDLIAAFGTNLAAAKNHYFANGIAEGREITFNTEQYLANYTDLRDAFGVNLQAATQHFITNGFREGRTDNINITDNLAFANVSSEVDANHGISAVLDGDTSTFNHTTSGDNAASMTFQFGRDYVLDEIDIVNRNDGAAWHQAIVNGRLNGATVEAFDDGVLVWSGTLTSAVNQSLDMGGVQADEVVINGVANQYLHIAEVDIFGDFLF